MDLDGAGSAPSAFSAWLTRWYPPGHRPHPHVGADARREKTGEGIFVDFEDAVAWGDVATTMDSIRKLALDPAHDQIRVALKVRTEPRGEPPPAR